jgi:F-type H+-transporting ATPase subunit alpha
MIDTVRPDEIASLLRKQLEGFAPSAESHETGIVLSVGDGIARLQGLPTVEAGELVQFAGKDNVFGLVLNLEQDNVGVVLLGEISSVREGDTARRTRCRPRSPRATPCWPRVDALGNPVDGGPAIVPQRCAASSEGARHHGAQERPRASPDGHQGDRLDDPIGRGQRDSSSATAAPARPPSRSTRSSTRRQRRQVLLRGHRPEAEHRRPGRGKLKDNGALEYTTVIIAGASDPAPLQYLPPTWLRDGRTLPRQRGHALIVFDDLTKQSRPTPDVPPAAPSSGPRSFPGDIFYVHSRLLSAPATHRQERRARSRRCPSSRRRRRRVGLHPDQRHLHHRRPDLLESGLFNAGVRPAMNVGISVLAWAATP